MKTVAAAAVIAALLVASAAAQFQGRRGRFMPQIGENPAYDGAFMFCRIMFRNASNGDGNGWYVDWPRADRISFRFSELTTTQVSRDVPATSITLSSSDHADRL
jgi:hypothetical protein